MRIITSTTTWSVKVFLPLFGLLLFLFSCQDPQQIGSELLPDAGQLRNGFTDTLTVRLSTIRQDSVTTANSGLSLVGRYVDPDLGPLESRAYLRFAGFDSLGYSVFDRYDSLVLYTRFGYAYGDTTKPQRLRAFRLSEPLVPQRRYQAADRVAIESTPIGTTTVRPRFVAAGQLLSDSVRIRLSDELGRSILSKAGVTETFKQNFPDWFRGIALVPDAANTAMLGFTGLTAQQTGQFSVPATIVLYYHREEPGRAVEKFAFTWYSGYVAGQLDGWSFNNLTTKYPGALAELASGQKILASRTKGLAFGQGNTGLTPLIELPYLDQFRNTPTGIRTVNKVELTLEPGAIPTGLTPPGSIQLVESDPRYQFARSQTGQLQYIASDFFAGSQADPIPSFSLVDGRYVADITLYVQSLMSRSKLNNGLLVRLNTAGTPRLSLDASKVKLRVYYTEAPK